MTPTAKAIVLVVKGDDAEATANQVARLIASTLVLNSWDCGVPAVIDWPVETP